MEAYDRRLIFGDTVSLFPAVNCDISRVHASPHILEMKYDLRDVKAAKIVAWQRFSSKTLSDPGYNLAAEEYHSEPPSDGNLLRLELLRTKFIGLIAYLLLCENQLRFGKRLVFGKAQLAVPQKN